MSNQSTVPVENLTMSREMENAHRYHQYQWDLVAPWVGKRVLEIGVGFGQYTERFLARNCQVLGCDYEQIHLDDLASRISNPMLSLSRIDLEAPLPWMDVCSNFQPDTIVLLNVIEHIRRDVESLAFLRKVSAPGANLIILTPAMPLLFNRLDSDAGHYRRYTRRSMHQLLAGAGWKALNLRYVNLPGMIGWLAAGWLSSGKKSTSGLNSKATNRLIRLYNLLFVPLTRATDPFVSRIAGLSIFAVGEHSSQ